MFHKVLQQMENDFDMIQSDKKKWNLWSKRLHIALQAYRELLFTLNAMDKSTDETIRQAAMVIKSNVFYLVEYREFIFQLLVTYTPQKFSREYLADLIETQHVFLKMLESYCSSNRSIVVKTKKVVRQKKKKTGKQSILYIVRLNSFFIKRFIVIIQRPVLKPNRECRWKINGMKSALNYPSF